MPGSSGTMDLVFKIGAESDPAQDELRELSMQVAVALDKIVKATEQAAAKAEASADKQTQANTEVVASSKKVADQAEKTSKDVQDSSGKQEKAAKDVEGANKKVAESAKQAGDAQSKSFNEATNAAGVLSPRLGAVSQTISGIGEASTSTAGMVGLAVGAVVALGAAAVTAGVAMYQLAKSGADTIDKFNDLSAQVNFSVQTLSALDAAAATSGTSIEAVSAALGIFDKNLQSAAQGNERMSRLFKALNVDIDDNEKALVQMFTALSKIPDGSQQTALAMAAFGRSGKDVLGIIKATNGDLPAFMQKMRDLGILLEDKDAQAANQFADQLALLGKQFDMAKAKVGVELMPVFTDLFTKLSDWITNNKGELQSWGKTFANAASMAVTAAADILWAYQKIRDIAPNTSVGRFKDDTPGGLLGLNREGSYYNQFVNYLGSLFDKNDPAAMNAAFGRVNMNAVPNQTAQQIAATAAANTAANKKAQEDAAEAARKAKELQDKINAALAGPGKEKRDGGDTAEQVLNRQLQVFRDSAEKIQLEYQKASDAEQESYDRRTVSLASFVENQKRVEGARLAQLGQMVDAEKMVILESAVPYGEKLAKIKDANQRLEKAQADHDREVSQLNKFQREKEEASEEAHRGRMAQIRAEADTFEIEQIKRQADREAVTYEEAQRKTNAIREKALLDKGKRLNADLVLAGADEEARQEVFDDITAWFNEYLNLLITSGQAVEDESRKDKSRRLDHLSFIQKNEAEVKRQNIANRLFMEEHFGMLNQSLFAYLTGYRDHVLKLRDLYIEQENDRHKDYLDEINIAEQKALLEDISGAKQLEIQKFYNRLREEEDARHKGATRDINEGAAEKTNTGIFGTQITPRDEFGNIIEDATAAEYAIVGLKKATQELGEIGLNAFRSMASGIGSLVSNYVLLGTTGPAALRKLLAATLAQVAGEASVKAILYTAEGLAALFINPAQAAGYFAAAGLMASIAGVAAITGRALAGDLFKPNQGGAVASADSNHSGRSFSANNNQTTVIEQNRNQSPVAARQAFKHELNVTLQWPDGGVARQLRIEYESNNPDATHVLESATHRF